VSLAAELWSGPWEISPALATALPLAAWIYARGWRALHARIPARLPRWRLAAFGGGLAVLFVALASPLDTLGPLVLCVHMAQHMLLMVLAPPLLLLGAPKLPLLRGLPTAAARSAAGQIVRWPPVRRLGALLAHPALGWSAMAVATWGWHTPAAFQLALRVEAWHVVEHASFLAAGLLFWWPVVEPWPSRRRWPRWAMVPYLLLADLQNTGLAALLTFSDRVIYPFYEGVPRIAGLSPLDDQTAAGVLMWVPMSIAYLVPACAITFRLLSPGRGARPAASRRALAPARSRGRARSRTSPAAP